MIMTHPEIVADRAVGIEHQLFSQGYTEGYVLVDDIPAVYEERQVVRYAAEQLLASRRGEAAKGYEYEPVDALSTAESVLRVEARHGTDTHEYTERWNGLLLDCQRLVGEWYRKKKPEYFEPVRQVFNSETAEFFSHGLSIRQMTENALVPITEDPEEEARRINERVEEATPQIVRQLGATALAGRSILTISECTDSAISSYEADMKSGARHRGYRGYVPEIKKLMLRFISFDPNSDDRYETQIGLPGEFHTHETLQIALARKGVDTQTMDKTELHGAQILIDDDPFSFVKHLDEVATKEWCTDIFMGETVPADFVKDYEAFRLEALQRKEDIKGWAETVAVFVLDLARSGYDRRKAPLKVEGFVKNLLLNLAKKDETIAEQMFDAKTAEGLRNVAALEAQGRFEEAQIRLQEVERSAPGGGSCGGGSCGLEGVASNSKEDEDLRKKLGADAGDTIVKDRERACKCGSKSIVYAYNKSKVIKYCQSCHAYEKTFKKAA